MPVGLLLRSPVVGDFAIARKQVGAGIIFTRRRNRDLTVQTSHTAAQVNLANVRIGIGRIAIESEEFSAFIRLLTRPVEEDEVNDTRHGIRAVNSGRAVFQDLSPGKSTDWNGVDVGKVERATPVNEGQRVGRPESAQVDERLSVTAVRVVFRDGVTDEGRQLAQTFNRGVGALFLQDFRGVNGDRQGRFRFRGRDIRSRDDDSLGGGFRGSGRRPGSVAGSCAYALAAIRKGTPTLTARAARRDPNVCSTFLIISFSIGLVRFGGED